MTIAQNTPTKEDKKLLVTWEKLPDSYQLEDEPVEHTGQPLLAGALRESLELGGFIESEMLIASNFALCATVNRKLVIKAPDWVYIAKTIPLEMQSDRKSYTPHLEGDVPIVVMEFLSDTDGMEYSIKSTYPQGKWFFYEKILKVPLYVIFEPINNQLEFYRLVSGKYELQEPKQQDLYWISEMQLYLGTWQGEKEGRIGHWLRWWDKQGMMLPWAVEQLERVQEKAEQERQKAEQERQKAEQERQKAEQERQRAEKLAAQLRQLGIEPES